MRPKNGEAQPDVLTVTPRILCDDGTLNDGNRNLSMPRAVIEWMEFEAPLAEVWPPDHHTRILFDSPLRESLAMVLVSPEFLCHNVADDGTTRQYEFASKLSCFLWGSMPD